MAFSDVFGDSSVARVLDHLAKYNSRDFSMTELARDCDMSYRTLQRIFPVLVQKELVMKTRRIGKADMYSLNLQNRMMKELHSLLVREEKQEKPQERQAENNNHKVAYI